ncbi:MAG TPA: DUF192 domain-containing protein [Candidatus Paceibacterota bacterium]|nr:DUF192 domain-containing protein [Candidatus Paceibacterota bacterium]
MTIRIAIASIVIALATIGSLYFIFAKKPALEMSTRVFEAAPETPFRFELADSPEERVQGLSGRRDVPSNYGLLFVFEESGSPGFWMKDMHVPIDIIWLAEDGTILGIEEAVSPDTYPQAFYPPRPVKLVLETRAYEARAQGWEVGSRVPLPF